MGFCVAPMRASLLALLWCAAAASAQDQPAWIGTWETSPAGLATSTKLGPVTLPPLVAIQGTVRYRLRISQGGAQIRLKFTNEYGNNPLLIAGASVGLAGHGLRAVSGSLQKVTFSGHEQFVVPPGAPALSDPVNLQVAPLSDLLVTVYVPRGMMVFECGRKETSPQQAWVAGEGATFREKWSHAQCLSTSMRPLVSEVDVLGSKTQKVVVALGDSITDGEVDPATGERGWPGALARRLQTAHVAVVNAGIGGNRLLQSEPTLLGASALSRLDRDVFAVPGISTIVLLEAINDIGMSGAQGWFGPTPLVEPQELIAAYSQVIDRAHERGIQVIGATLLPFEGSPYYTSEKERVRVALNDWIRSSRSFDGLIDFDAAMRVPDSPTRLKPQFDFGDHLHPNYAGYRAMAEAIDLKLFD